MLWNEFILCNNIWNSWNAKVDKFYLFSMFYTFMNISKLLENHRFSKTIKMDKNLCFFFRCWYLLFSWILMFRSLFRKKFHWFPFTIRFFDACAFAQFPSFLAQCILVAIFHQIPSLLFFSCCWISIKFFNMKKSEKKY